MTRFLKIVLLVFSLIVLTLTAFIYSRRNEDSWTKDKSGNWVKHGNPEVIDFSSCALKYPTQESFPRNCSIPNGPTFTENIQKLAVYGDSRDGHDTHRKIVNEIVGFNPDYIFHTGDLVGDGSKKEQWDVFNSIVEPIMDRLYPVLGNHEKNDQNYYNNFTLPGNEQWYYNETEFIYYICIDSNKILDPDAIQLNWFKDQLITAKQSGKLVAVIMHHPLFSSSTHANDEISIKLREALAPLIEGKVNVVFAGHDHVYERLEKGRVSYFTIGSAGAPLYQIKNKSPYSIRFESKYSYAQLLSTKEKMLIKIIDENGEEFDSLEINKK